MCGLFRTSANHVVALFCRDAPEATGDEPEEADFDMPKIYEPVSGTGNSCLK